MSVLFRGERFADAPLSVHSAYNCVQML